MVFPAVMYRVESITNIAALVVNEAGPAWDQFLYFEISRVLGDIAIIKEPLILYRIHNNQDSQIRGSTMNFLLINYLLENPNYKEVVLNNNKKLYLYIKGSFQIGFQNFLINRNKQTFRNNCKQIPTICKKSFLGKYYACLYFIVSSTPSFFAFFYIVLRRIKRLFKHDK